MFKTGSGNWMCPVHCEFRLIQYLKTRRGDQWDLVPPFNYIGVSKFSCGACCIWMEASNERGWKFYTRGSHGKWYWPWAVPGSEGDVADAMAQKVFDKYRVYLTDQQLLRSYSDSSDASSQGAEHVISDDQENNTRAANVASLQAYGGSGFEYFDAQRPDA